MIQFLSVFFTFTGLPWPWVLGSSDFPRSLCFMWFWFGLEILRLVYKKEFFKILNGFYLIWPFNLKKNSTVPSKNWKKISSKLVAKGIKRSGILRWFQELLRQEVPNDFFSEKQFFSTFSKSQKIQFFCKIFSPFAKLETSAHFLNQRKIPLLLIPCTPNFEEIFCELLSGAMLLFSEDKRSNKIETVQYFKKRFFIN